MSFGFLIQSIFELIFIIALIIGLIHEDKLARWEAKLWQRIKERVMNAARSGR